MDANDIGLSDRPETTDLWFTLHHWEPTPMSATFAGVSMEVVRDWAEHGPEDWRITFRLLCPPVAPDRHVAVTSGGVVRLYAVSRPRLENR